MKKQDKVWIQHLTHARACSVLHVARTRTNLTTIHKNSKLPPKCEHCSTNFKFPHAQYQIQHSSVILPLEIFQNLDWEFSCMCANRWTNWHMILAAWIFHSLTKNCPWNWNKLYAESSSQSHKLHIRHDAKSHVDIQGMIHMQHQLLTSSGSTGFVNSLNFLSARSLFVASLRKTLSSLNTASLCFRTRVSSGLFSSRGLGGEATGNSSRGISSGEKRRGGKLKKIGEQN